MIFLDKVRSPFTDHDARRIDVPAWDLRHDTGICDPQVPDAFNAKPFVDNVAYPACAAEMVDRIAKMQGMVFQ